MAGGREITLDAPGQGLQPRTRLGSGRFFLLDRSYWLRPGSVKRRGEASKACFDAYAASSNGVFELRSIKRQRAGAGESAKEGGTYHAARLLGNPRKIAMNE